MACVVEDDCMFVDAVMRSTWSQIATGPVTQPMRMPELMILDAESSLTTRPTSPLTSGSSEKSERGRCSSPYCVREEEEKDKTHVEPVVWVICARQPAYSSHGPSRMIRSCFLASLSSSRFLDSGADAPVGFDPHGMV